YATSHALEELAGGYLLKDVRTPASSKPAFLHDPAREPETYRLILAGTGIAPRCDGLRDGKLVLEKVDGVELWQIGELETWCLVARELARAHERLAAFAGEPFLLRYDSAWYELWLRRARERVVALDPV